jgi:hypothetical protein
MMSSLIPYAFGGLFCIGGIFLLFQAFSAARKIAAARSWPIAEGTLVSASVKSHTGSMSSGSHKSRKSYEAVANYTFSAGDKSYKGNRIFLSEYSGSKTFAENVVETLKAASPLNVYYNPADPKNAVLQLKSPGAGLMLLLGIVCAGIGILALALGPAFYAFFAS